MKDTTKKQIINLRTRLLNITHSDNLIKFKEVKEVFENCNSDVSKLLLPFIKNKNINFKFITVEGVNEKVKITREGKPGKFHSISCFSNNWQGETEFNELRVFEIENNSNLKDYRFLFSEITFKMLNFLFIKNNMFKIGF